MLKPMPIIIAATIVAGISYAKSEPFDTVGPWEIAMPEIDQASCIGSRAYPDTVFSFSLSPDGDGTWSLWLTFFSKGYHAAQGQKINAVFRFDQTETLQLTGSATGDGLVYFWTPATEQTLAALETAAWLGVSTKTTSARYPLDGIDAAMTAVNECWNEKRRREADPV